MKKMIALIALFFELQLSIDQKKKIFSLLELLNYFEL